ncbi:MAG: TAXI family TRAP transporter solute-binding subunit [Ramlibacter sp.]
MAAARLYQRKWVLIKLPIAVAAVAVMAWLWTTWLPLPPSTITLSAGRADGVYHAYASRYAEAFARQGVTLKVLESEGSLQNLQRLRGQASPQADLAFMQGGIGYPPAERDTGARILTLSRVDIEPLWIFSRLAYVDGIQQFQGLRVSLGPAGSGTRQLALALLDQVRLLPRDITDSELSGMAAVDALRQGTLDVMLMVSAPESRVVRALLSTPGIHLVQLRRTAALTERLPYLQTRLLPQGTLDGAHQPARDVSVLTTSASLVARADLHPALQRLATQVAGGIHARGGVFHEPGEFPSLKRVEFPASEEARRTLIHGLPWLEDRLPFWWAQIVMRLLVVCLPVALLAYWLARMLPAYLRWLLESRVTRWYGELKYIEYDLTRDSLSGLDLTKYLDRLNSIERRMADFVTPAYLMPRWFTLRQHIDFVRMGIFRRRGR